jgi:DNA replication licensing factor MCM2
VSYIHLSKHSPLLAVWLADEPTEMLRIFDEVAYAVALDMFRNYTGIRNEIHVRITDLPISEPLRDIRFKQKQQNNKTKDFFRN